MAEHPNQIDNSPFAAFWNNPIRYIDPDGRFLRNSDNGENLSDGQRYTSTGGSEYIFGNGDWTRQGGTLSEVTVTANRVAAQGHGDTPWMTAAEGQLGVTEIAGSKHNPSVIGYQATTGGFKDDETSWCSSFVNWSVKQAGIKGTNSARALSWRGWGQSLSNPAYGSIAIIDYGGGRGHVGFVAGVTSSGSIVLLGGNQSNMARYSAFSPSSISGYAYPSGYIPNYTLPTLIINKVGGFGGTR